MPCAAGLLPTSRKFSAHFYLLNFDYASFDELRGEPWLLRSFHKLSYKFFDGLCIREFVDKSACELFHELCIQDFVDELSREHVDTLFVILLEIVYGRLILSFSDSGLFDHPCNKV